jgi:hypothetical protein
MHRIAAAAQHDEGEQKRQRHHDRQAETTEASRPGYHPIMPRAKRT